jgi:DNA-binding LacI/PurR family transcriptional regulator
MVTISDIARSLGVSSATVSRALNGSRLVAEDVRASVEKAAAELGFQKRTIRRQRHRAILNIKLALPKFRNPELSLFYDFSALVEGLESGFTLCGINILCVINGPDYDPFPHKKGGDIDAFVFAFQQPPEATLQKLRDQGTPFVILNRAIPGLPCVASDHDAGMRDLLDHLLKTKPRLRPRFISLKGLGQIHDERLKAFSKACIDRDIAFDPGHDVTLFPDIAAIQSNSAKLAAKGANALVCVNDIVASVLLTELDRAGIKVPAQVCVTGFDDSPVRRLSRPMLTTLSMPVAELARHAAVRLQSQILENSPPAPLLRVAGQLIIGEST